VPGERNTVADGLSRRPPTAREYQELEQEQDIDDFLDAEFNYSYLSSPMEADPESEPVLNPEVNWSEESLQIARYLRSLERPEGMSSSQFHRFRKKATKFLIQTGFLFKRGNKNIPAKRVVDDPAEKIRIKQSLHEESGHRGREGTYRKIADRYWWEGMYEDVAKWIKTCDGCQRAVDMRPQESLNPTWESMPFQRIHLDVCKAPRAEGKNCFVVARCDFTGWPEGRPLHTASAALVAKFLYEDVICRYSCVPIVVNDGGPENKALVRVLFRRYKVKNIVITPYNPRANGQVECGHKPFILALRKLTQGSGKLWPRHFSSLLWSERVTVRNPTGMTPAELLYGYEPVLPVELEVPTWRTLPWEAVHTTADLLAMRARQIERRDADMAEAALRLRRLRERNKDLFDERHNLRQSDLDLGKLVLLHDTKLEPDYSAKLSFRWKGPYRINEVYPNGTYLLEELDGTFFKNKIHGNRLKSYLPRQADERYDSEDLTMLDYTEEDLDDEDEFGIHPHLPDEEVEDHIQTGPHLTETPPDDTQEDLSWIPDGFDFAVLVPQPESHEGVEGGIN
jgi:hypothetical protein